METGLTKNRILSELTKSPHGKLADYIAIGKQAAVTESEFLAHLIAWNRNNGQIRDSKVALPVISLSAPIHEEFVDNALAHLALLGPREFLRAYRFALEVRPAGKMLRLRRLIQEYLRDKETGSHLNNTLVLHRKVMKELYALGHVKPTDYVNRILFRNEKPAGSVFDVISRLKEMSPTEASAEIMNRKIPFLIALGALGEKAKNPDLVLALIQRMSPTELVTNTKMLENLGVKNSPALRGAFEEGLKKAATSKANVLKTSRAVDFVEDESLKEKLRGLQDKQLKNMGPEGNWLVLADKSGSMESAIEISKQVAATLAKMVKGKVYLVFFDITPLFIDVTGLSLDQIQKATRHITANGYTSIGCGLRRMYDENIEVDGIAVVSDGAENEPPYFYQVYQVYSKKFDKQPTVYLYHCGNKDNSFNHYCRMNAIDVQTFDVANSVDFYALPNLVSTMRTNRYSLVDEVMSSKLLSLSDILKSERKEVAIHA